MQCPSGGGVPKYPVTLNHGGVGVRLGDGVVLRMGFVGL